MKYRFILYSAAIVWITLILTSCTGRTDKNMTPTGDTIEVVIPEPANEQVQDFTPESVPESDLQSEPQSDIKSDTVSSGSSIPGSDNLTGNM